jgi:hypothetical protein
VASSHHLDRGVKPHQLRTQHRVRLGHGLAHGLAGAGVEDVGAALEKDAHSVGRQVSFLTMSRVRHRLYLSALGLTSAWAVARLVSTASDFAAAHSIGGTPARASPSVSGFDADEYLRRKGIAFHEVVSIAKERHAERRAIARSRALLDVAVAFGPLLALVGLHSYFRRLPRRTTQVT